MPTVGATFRYVEETVIAATARATSGDSEAVAGFGPANTLRAQLNVTAAAGTGTLDVVIEDTLDGTNWNTIGTFAQKGAVGREVINVTSPFADRLRVRHTIGGVGASFTFSVLVASQSAFS